MPEQPLVPFPQVLLVFSVTAVREVGSFTIQASNDFVAGLQNRVINAGYSYLASAAAVSTVSPVLNLWSPVKCAQEGITYVQAASNLGEACERSALAASLIYLGGQSTATPGTALAYGAFIVSLTGTITSRSAMCHCKYPTGYVYCFSHNRSSNSHYC